MSLAGLITFGVAVVALCAAAFHGWIFRVRRSERLHLWHAIVALGVTGLTGATAFGYGSTTVAEAEHWQRLAFVFSVPVTVGFLQFSWD